VTEIYLTRVKCLLYSTTQNTNLCSAGRVAFGPDPSIKILVFTIVGQSNAYLYFSKHDLKNGLASCFQGGCCITLQN